MTDPNYECQDSNLESSKRRNPLDWNEAEALLETRTVLMHPEARMALKSIRAHECQESFEALVEFFGDLELVEEESPFETAAKTLDTIYDAFDKIDVDHDEILSKEELENYFDKRLENSKEYGPEPYYELQNESTALQWLVRNYGTLQFAKFLRWSKGLCRQDLKEASSIFKGLKLLQDNFEDVSETDERGEKEVTVESLVPFIVQNQDNYSAEDVESLEHLCVYIARIENEDPEHHGLTFEGLSNLGPEQLWGRRAEKLKNEHDIGFRQND